MKTQEQIEQNLIKRLSKQNQEKLLRFIIDSI